MKPIQMVDLKGQYDKIKTEVDAAMQQVIDTTAFIKGPDVKEFEKELAQYTGAKHCISCANGTDALQIAMMALGLTSGDEIIMPAFTYIATVETAALLGLKVVLVDVDPLLFTIDPHKIEEAITPKTKAIVPVHLYGQCANMEQIMSIAQTHKLFVIEDVAQAIGSEYTFFDGTKVQAGTIGDIGCTSFFPSKNLGCFGDGGAMFTTNDALAKQITMIANHGQPQKYIHEIVGVNSRLDTLQAALLRVKLKHLTQYTKARQEAATYYDTHLETKKVAVPYRNSFSSHVFHQYTIILKNTDRDTFKNALEKAGIPSMVYYPLPIHFQKAFSNLGYQKGDFPNAEFLCENVISLPIHTELDQVQLEYIVKCVNEFA
jgi:dTDP-4-amino-4,6-dideoxygalactose transaminase